MESFNIIYFGSNKLKKFCKTLIFNVQYQNFPNLYKKFYKGVLSHKFGPTQNSKIIISLDTYTTQKKNQTIIVKNCFNNHYDSACSANKKYGKFTYK